MKMDLIQMIDTLERAQQTQYIAGVQDVIRGLREMLKEQLAVTPSQLSRAQGMVRGDRDAAQQ